MKYRDAKKLHNEDEVTRKNDGVTLTVKSIEVIWSSKTVRISAIDPTNTLVILYHDEIL